MRRLPVIVSIIVTLLVLAAAVLLASHSYLMLTDAQLVQSEIALFGLLGAAVSATFVVYEYLQTSRAFVESQRPQLLIQVLNGYEQASPDARRVPVSEFHYKNITANRFINLTLHIALDLNGTSVDLSDLFPQGMVMVGLDARQKTFKPFQLLAEHGIAMEAAVTAGKESILSISYSYSYNGRLETLHVQKYVWDNATLGWQIA